MDKIVRTKTKALGGVTKRELALMEDHSKLWIARAMRTDPIDPDKIIPAIEGLYRVAGLKKPRVVIVPSPLVMAFAYGASAAIWYARKHPEKALSATLSATDFATRSATASATASATDSATASATHLATAGATRIATAGATYIATRRATYSATASATDSATASATDSATRNVTDRATRSATHIATAGATRIATAGATYIATASATDIATETPEAEAARACRDMTGEFGITCAQRWSNNYQGGNMWAGYDCYLTACRDILGLELREHEAYAHWEQAAIHGGFRVMHEEFCMVSDFPEILLKDDQNRPHCESGPSHRWRDGWSLYHWHGTVVPREWIEDRPSLTPAIALGQTNIELRRAACEILGWANILSALNAKTVDSDPDPQIGDLVEVELPGLTHHAKFLRVRCGTGREFAIGVPPHITKALDAQAWIVGLDPSEFTKPEIRA